MPSYWISLRLLLYRSNGNTKNIITGTCTINKPWFEINCTFPASTIASCGHAGPHRQTVQYLVDIPNVMFGGTLLVLLFPLCLGLCLKSWIALNWNCSWAVVSPVLTAALFRVMKSRGGSPFFPCDCRYATCDHDVNATDKHIFT